MVRFVHVLALLAILVVSWSPEVTAGPYRSRVESWKRDFLRDRNICNQQRNLKNTMLNAAVNKRYTTINNNNVDHKAAAVIVNLYTQLAGNGCFYAELNRQLRTGRPSATFKTYAKLLNDAISLLARTVNKGRIVFSKTYRGTGRIDEIKRTGYATLKAFTSTSTDPLVPFSFNPAIYIIFKNVRGLEVVSLSAHPNQKEILLKSGYRLRATKYLTRRTDIDRELRPFIRDAAKRAKVKTVIVTDG